LRPGSALHLTPLEELAALSLSLVPDPIAEEEEEERKG